MGQALQESPSIVTMNSLVLTLVICLVSGSLATTGIEVSSTWSRQLGLCCGSVRTKCAAACANAACDVQCSGNCGFFNTLCGPYTCSSVSNACTGSSSDTTTTTTTTTTACLPATGYCIVNNVPVGIACCTGSTCLPDSTDPTNGKCQ